MSKTELTEKDKKLAHIIVDMYKSVEEHTKNIASLEEQLYKNYQAMALDKQEELDNTSKLFKKKRERIPWKFSLSIWAYYKYNYEGEDETQHTSDGGGQEMKSVKED